MSETQKGKVGQLEGEGEKCHSFSQWGKAQKIRNVFKNRPWLPYDVLPFFIHILDFFFYYMSPHQPLSQRVNNHISLLSTSFAFFLLPCVCKVVFPPLLFSLSPFDTCLPVCREWEEGDPFCSHKKARAGRERVERGQWPMTDCILYLAQSYMLRKEPASQGNWRERERQVYTGCMLSTHRQTHSLIP